MMTDGQTDRRTWRETRIYLNKNIRWNSNHIQNSSLSRDADEDWICCSSSATSRRHLSWFEPPTNLGLASLALRTLHGMSTTCSCICFWARVKAARKSPVRSTPSKQWTSICFCRGKSDRMEMLYIPFLSNFDWWCLAGKEILGTEKVATCMFHTPCRVPFTCWYLRFFSTCLTKWVKAETSFGTESKPAELWVHFPV